MEKPIVQENGTIILCVPSREELRYLHALRKSRDDIICLTSHRGVKQEIEEMGFNHVELVDKTHSYLEIQPAGKVIVLDNDLRSTKFFISLVSVSMLAPIIVVTKYKSLPSRLYRLLGANIVIYSNDENIEFLLNIARR